MNGRRRDIVRVIQAISCTLGKPREELDQCQQDGILPRWLLKSFVRATEMTRQSSAKLGFCPVISYSVWSVEDLAFKISIIPPLTTYGLACFCTHMQLILLCMLSAAHDYCAFP